MADHIEQTNGALQALEGVLTEFEWLSDGALTRIAGGASASYITPKLALALKNARGALRQTEDASLGAKSLAA